jgi:DNA-binding MarR family transcriptional regulator
MAKKPKGNAAAERPPNDGGVSELDNILGFHIRLAHGTVYRHFTETFSHVGLTQKQVSVLWLVDQFAGISQADLGRRLQIDRATVMAIVNRVQERGYLERRKSSVDGRLQTLTLTPDGAQALANARKAIAEHEQWLRARFTDAEVATLISLLRAIHG